MFNILCWEPMSAVLLLLLFFRSPFCSVKVAKVLWLSLMALLYLSAVVCRACVHDADSCRVLSRGVHRCQRRSRRIRRVQPIVVSGRLLADDRVYVSAGVRQ